jgi:hypothetical protein
MVAAEDVCDAARQAAIMVLGQKNGLRIADFISVTRV